MLHQVRARPSKPCPSLARSLAPKPRPQASPPSLARNLTRSIARRLTRYEALVSAAKAQEALDGRDFDGNAVSATFLPDNSI